jgi:hypothetical protein
LLSAHTQAMQDYYATYVDAQDHLKVFERWGANDGPDDAAEATNDWVLLHALGADDSLLTLSQRFWKGICANIPASRPAMCRLPAKACITANSRSRWIGSIIPRAFDVQHHGPVGAARSARVDAHRRFADFYTGADKTVANYDPHRVIRSILNGGRGRCCAGRRPWTGRAIRLTPAGSIWNMARTAMSSSCAIMMNMMMWPAIRR